MHELGPQCRPCWADAWHDRMVTDFLGATRYRTPIRSGNLQPRGRVVDWKPTGTLHAVDAAADARERTTLCGILADTSWWTWKDFDQAPPSEQCDVCTAELRRAELARRVG